MIFSEKIAIGFINYCNRMDSEDLLWADPKNIYTFHFTRMCITNIEKYMYGSAEGPPRGVDNRNLVSHPHPDDLRMEGYAIRMTQ